MKKTAHFESVDGYRVFAGIVSEAAVDPEKTREQVNLAAAGLPVQKKIADAKAAFDKAAKQAYAALKDAEIAEKNNDKEGYEKAGILYNRARQKMEEAEKESSALYRELEAERDRLFYEKAVYFENLSDAVLLEENAAGALLKKFGELPPRTVLTVQGEAVPDFRGAEYWIKDAEAGWQNQKIQALGVQPPQNAVLEEDLAAEQRGEIEEQRDKARVAALSAEEKAAELSRMLDSAADEAVRLEGRARLQGAAFDAQERYQNRKAELEKKYG